MTTVVDTGRTVALLPEGAPGWQVVLSRVCTWSSVAASVAALAGVGPVYADPTAWLPDPLTALVALVALAVGWAAVAAARFSWRWFGAMRVLVPLASLEEGRGTPTRKSDRGDRTSRPPGRLSSSDSGIRL